MVLKLVSILYFYDEVQVFLGKCPEGISYICTLVEDGNFIVLKNTEKLTTSFLEGSVDLLELYKSSENFHQGFLAPDDCFYCFKTHKEDIEPEWYPEAGFILGSEGI